MSGMHVGIPEPLTVPMVVQPGVVSLIVEEMERRGLVVPKEGRMEPFEVSEIMEVSGLGRSTIERLIHGGMLKKLEGTGRLLVSAESVREWLKGGCQK